MPASPVLRDIVCRPAPNAVQLRGWLGARFHGSRMNRLQHQEEDHLLWPFRDHCPVGWYPNHQPYPGVRSDWQGEFLGTWMDAAVLTAWNAGDGALRAKIDALLTDWLKTQQADGYLGTYDEPDRWKSWDIWVQAHDLIGLLSYYRLTGRADVLDSAVRIVERVLQDFGPGKRSLRETGPHMGMASSAFLEPLLWVYWETGEPRYLEFARWLVDEDWEGTGGAQILSSLLAGNGVANTANAKGIEMLIDFAGLLELHRATGEAKYRQAILFAWEDLVRHHLYITGSASTGEYFPKDFALKNDGLFLIGETCVSMGWFYLNLSLFRLTGEARFLDMAEQTLYNHLLAAQSPDGKYWAYYLGLRDSKRYRWHTDPECCPSRGVRAVAHIPWHVFGLWRDGVSVNFYEDAYASLPLPSGQIAGFDMQTAYPLDGTVRITIETPEAGEFTLRLRLPGWVQQHTMKINSDGMDFPVEDGFLILNRTWQPGDIVTLQMEMPVQVVADRLGNNGRAAVTRGPLVYAADASYLPDGVLLDDVILGLDCCAPEYGLRVQPVEGSVHILARRRKRALADGPGWWSEPERYQRLGQGRLEYAGEIELVPFFEAGNRSVSPARMDVTPNDEAVRNITLQVWLPYQCAGGE